MRFADASGANAHSAARMHIVVRGTVQGVGFRPFVYRRAIQLGLTGWVGNASDGVIMEVEGTRAHICDLVDSLHDAPPANAVVVAVEARELTILGDTSFAIRASQMNAGTTALVADLATCADCLSELFDARDRRAGYPFINCTQCGPRYSIIEDLPYDRERTSMRGFQMCRACVSEYRDPRSRRFHAEPNACPECGPRVALWDAAGATSYRDHDAILAAAAALRSGKIVSVKGIGGFHLMVDARNEAAVARLRQRKRRDAKPFAVMFPVLADIEQACRVSELERDLLISPARPIMLLRGVGGSLAAAVAPGNPWIGALLPYAPIQHLLLRELAFPLVATSGNVADEPIVTDERDALRRLHGIADCHLVHDRPIVRAIDDSVLRVVCGRELMLRRARGYAPAPIAIEGAAAGVLALGGHLKATVAVTSTNAAVLSQHIGDLQTDDARTAHTRVCADLMHLHATRASVIVRDLHPDYASSCTAEAFGAPVVGVQHHLAHVAACMAEHGVTPPLLGVAWDGAGYGADGTVWGGEFLAVSETGWRRVAHLAPFRLPGGDAAAREPRRAAMGLLYAAFGDATFDMTWLAPVAAFTRNEAAVLRAMLDRGINAPFASSVGRLFDAFAALCGVRQHASYEGQAAAELEWSAAGSAQARSYPFVLRDPVDGGEAMILDWRCALDAVLEDLAARTPISDISAALHSGLAEGIVAVAQRLGERRVILTGGCFQNARLTEAAVGALRAAGFEAIWHRRVPPNDGGIALGQAAWVAWRGWTEPTRCV